MDLDGVTAYRAEPTCPRGRRQRRRLLGYLQDIDIERYRSLIDRRCRRA